MKDPIYSFHLTLAAIVLLLLLCQQTDAQPANSVEVKTGVGLEQGFSIGFNMYYRKNANIGLGIGSHFPSKDSAHHIAVFAEHNLHIPFKRTKNIKPAIVFNQQVLFWKYSQPDFSHQAVTFALSVGGRVESRDNYGLLLEVGPSITYTLQFQREPGSTVTPVTNTIQPNFRFLFFQRF